MQVWLTEHDKRWTADMLKSELYELVKKNNPEPGYICDFMVLEEGFVVVKTRKKLPLEWKTATAEPVFKRGDTSLPTNYRLISLLCILSKVIEKVVYHRLSPFLQPAISSHQSGFQKKDGTTFQLWRLV